MWGMEADVKLAGNWAINTVENLADNQPQKCGADVAIYDRLKRNETGQGTAGSEQVNTESCPALGWGGFSFWHTASLWRKPSTLDLWVRAEHGSNASGFWFRSRMAASELHWCGNFFTNMA